MTPYLNLLPETAAQREHSLREVFKLHAAADTLGQVLALHITPADADGRAAVSTLANAV